MRIDCLSINDKNGLDRVYVLLNSIKQTKNKDTTIVYHLIIEDLDQTIKQYFADLESEDFVIQFTECRQFKDKINLPEAKYYCSKNYYTMVRCLCPSYFKQLDKVLYLDTDLVFLREGIEQLWNTDISDCYLAGCQDLIITKYKPCQIELKNLKYPQKYVNGGVLLFNYKLMREDKKDEELASWCTSWKVDQIKPFYLDQSLMNHLLRDKLKYLDYKFNDVSLVTSSYVYKNIKQHLMQNYNYTVPVNSIKDAVILHFLGDLKPWKNFNIEKVKEYYPYAEVTKVIWNNIEKVLKKNEQKESTEV